MTVQADEARVNVKLLICAAGMSVVRGRRCVVLSFSWRAAVRRVVCVGASWIAHLLPSWATVSRPPPRHFAAAA